jgi:ligand-binding sensor domain-containing protein
MRFSFFLFLLLLLFFTTKSTGQKLDCSYRNYTIKDGLPANLIFDLSEDKDGYVWIATSGGLSRFDGKNFVNFDNHTNPDFFEDNYIYSIYEFGEKLLYFMSS